MKTIPELIELLGDDLISMNRRNMDFTQWKKDQSQSQYNGWFAHGRGKFTKGDTLEEALNNLWLKGK